MGRLFRVRRWFSGPLTQIAVNVAGIGIGLYVADVATDIAAAVTYLRLSRQYHQETPVYYSAVVAGLILVPGLFAGARSLLRKELHLGVGKAFQLERWYHWLLAPPYLVVMSLWSILMPLIRHFEFAKHLWLEWRGLTDYDEAYLLRAVESKELEGLAEAAPQFAFQIFIHVRSMFTTKGLGDIGHQGLYAPPRLLVDLPRESFQILLRLMLREYQLVAQLVTSTLSVARNVVACQANQVRKIGRVSEPAPPSYVFILFAWCLWSVVTKAAVLALVGALVSAIYELYDGQEWYVSPGDVAASLYLALFALFVALNVTLHWVTWREADSALTGGLLSLLAPVGFVHPERDSARRLLVLYAALHQAFLYLCVLLPLILALNLNGIVETYFLASVFFSPSLLILAIFFVCGLDPLYSRSPLAHPSMERLRDRLETYPAEDAADLEGADKADFFNLAARGHFYSDVRHRRLLTTCYWCGKVRAAGDSEFHQQECGAMASCAREIDAAVHALNGQCPAPHRDRQEEGGEEDGRSTVAGIVNVLVGLCSLAALSTGLYVACSRADHQGWKLLLILVFLWSLSYPFNLLLGVAFCPKGRDLKWLLKGVLLQMLTWRPEKAKNWILVAVTCYLPNALHTLAFLHMCYSDLGLVSTLVNYI